MDDGGRTWLPNSDVKLIIKNSPSSGNISAHVDNCGICLGPSCLLSQFRLEVILKVLIDMFSNFI
jgi:hypothetical protein